MTSKPGKKVAVDGHEYHVSKTANATVAPTNAATLANLNAATKGMGSDQVEFITLVHYEYGLSGEVNPDHIKKEYGYTDAEYDSFISNERVIAALVERGLSDRLFKATESSVKAKITPQQLVVANLMLDVNDTRSPRKKLQDQNVKTATWQMWVKDPNFKAYLQARAEGLLGDISHEAMLALVDNVVRGDLKSIQYYHEITGRYVPASSSAAVGTTSANDMQQIIVKIIEIIVDEVTDKAEALRIADRLKGLVMGNQVAGILPAPIEQPEIAVSREMTEEVKELMSRGAGYND